MACVARRGGARAPYPSTSPPMGWHGMGVVPPLPGAHAVPGPVVAEHMLELAEYFETFCRRGGRKPSGPLRPFHRRTGATGSVALSVASTVETGVRSTYPLLSLAARRAACVMT
jgi:hypothetical protein